MVLWLWCSLQGHREVFEAQGQNCKTRPLVSVIEVSRRGGKQGNLEELNLEALLLQAAPIGRFLEYI